MFSQYLCLTKLYTINKASKEYSFAIMQIVLRVRKIVWIILLFGKQIYFKLGDTRAIIFRLKGLI